MSLIGTLLSNTHLAGHKPDSKWIESRIESDLHRALLFIRAEDGDVEAQKELQAMRDAEFQDIRKTMRAYYGLDGNENR